VNTGALTISGRPASGRSASTHAELYIQISKSSRVLVFGRLTLIREIITLPGGVFERGWAVEAIGVRVPSVPRHAKQTSGRSASRARKVGLFRLCSGFVPGSLGQFPGSFTGQDRLFLVTSRLRSGYFSCQPNSARVELRMASYFGSHGR